MITRRMFHFRMLAALAATTVPRPGWAAGGAEAQRLWLNRLTFGATGAEVDRAGQLGLGPWLDWQLSLPATDPGLQARLDAARLRITYEAGEDEFGNTWPALDEMRPLSGLAADPADLLHLQDWGPGKGMDYAERIRPAREVVAASLIRAVHAEPQLREVMTQFWHDHFNVKATKHEATALSFPSYDALLRTHALGNFRLLLGEVARSAAMLYYLDNADSIASPANENYARELLELHTLGANNYLIDSYSDWRAVPGAIERLAEGYLDLDVYEVARAFTGWSVGDGRMLAEGEFAPRTGRFHYVDRWHDPYQKRILGREFSPYRGPMADGDEVLDMLASHPGTARFVCTKLARRLLSDDPPPALVDRMSGIFLAAADAPDQIAQVLRLLVLSPEFEAPPSKLRRPFEFLAALYRATGAEVVTDQNDWAFQLSGAGWHQHEFGAPTGHPDRLEAWTGTSTLNRMVDIALYAHEGWFGGTTADLGALATKDEAAMDFLRRQTTTLSPETAAAAVEEVAKVFGINADTPANDYTAEDRHNAAAAAIAFAALTPEFLFR